MKFFCPFGRLLTLVLFVLLQACVSLDSNSPQPVSPLNRGAYPAQTVSSPALVLPTPTNAGLQLITPSPMPAQASILLPTPTPFSYTIKAGDTISQIAQRYGLTLDELIIANPGINTQILSVGQVIQVPSRPASLTDFAPAPAELEIGPIRCFPSGAGMWCLALLHNPHLQPVENITAQISIFDEAAQLQSSLESLVPLNILPAGTSLPLSAFFPSRPLEPFSARIDVVTAFLLAPDDPRYLPVRVDNVLATISADGLSTQIAGRLVMSESNQPAGQIWLAAVAYDENDQVVGFRRWQSSDELDAGQSQVFAFSVYSLGPPISRIEVIPEARP
jgi:LysM repeat protein